MGERPHKRLIAWQKAMALVREIDALTKRFPMEERFGLTPQMRRAAISIASNLAEGATRRTDKEKIQFFSVAAGSASELDTQLEICGQVKLISQEQQEQAQALLDHVSRLISGLVRSRKDRQETR